MDSTAYALSAVKDLKESFDNAQQLSMDQYMDSKLFDIYSTTEVFEVYTSTEGLTGSKLLGELETPPSLSLEEGYTVTIREKRFGGAVILPEQVYRRDGNDSTMKVDQFLMRQRDQLIKDNTNFLLVEMHKMYNEAFDNTSDYLAPDGVEICGSHTWNSGGTFDNGVTAAFSEDEVDTALEYAGAFTDPSGKPMPLNFNTIVVKKGSAASRLAKRLFAMGISPVAVADINIYEGEFTIIETPYISAANKAYWFMLDSTLDNPLKVGIGEYPTLREPIKESNESIRTNVTGFWKQGCVNMSYSIYGSNGTT